MRGNVGEISPNVRFNFTKPITTGLQWRASVTLFVLTVQGDAATVTILPR